MKSETKLDVDMLSGNMSYKNAYHFFLISYEIYTNLFFTGMPKPKGKRHQHLKNIRKLRWIPKNLDFYDVKGKQNIAYDSHDCHIHVCTK